MVTHDQRAPYPRARGTQFHYARKKFDSGALPARAGDSVNTRPAAAADFLRLPEF
jgi:hypothetical protein